MLQNSNYDILGHSPDPELN